MPGQRQFTENICSEDDLRSAASPRIFKHLKNGIIAPFERIFTLKGSSRIFGAFILAEIFEKVRFDSYNLWITRLSARKSEQKKNF